MEKRATRAKERKKKKKTRNQTGRECPTTSAALVAKDIIRKATSSPGAQV
jgi:hypothetical protein